MSGIALLGTILNTQMRKEGFYFWLCSNIYMMFADYQAGLYAQSVLFFIYALLAIRGIFIWNRKQKGKPGEKPIKINRKSTNTDRTFLYEYLKK